MRIDIFLETDTKGLYKRDRGLTWFLMESENKNKTYVKQDRISWLELNRNGAALEGIVYALTQIRAKNSEIYIHINNIYICGYSRKLEEWKKSGYRNRKGNPIRYREHWRKIGEVLKNNNNKIFFSSELTEEKRQKLEEYRKSIKTA